MENIIAKAKSLDNSIKIDLNLCFNTIDTFRLLLDMFFKDLNKDRIHKKKYEQAFQSIIANLLYTYRVDPTKHISVSLCKDFFINEVNVFKIRYDVFIKLFNWLKKTNYITTFIGFRNQKKSRQTRFIQTDKLIKLFKLVKNVHYDKEFSTKKKIIILKNTEKKSIPYKITSLVKKRITLLEDFNKVLFYSSISFKGKILPKPFIFRIFNNSSFKSGGRFYGGYFQQFTKRDRKKLFINGNKTVELDFNCLHINLLYNKINKTYDRDAYQLQSFPLKEFRGSIKLITLIMINASSREDALKSCRYAMTTGKIKELNIDTAFNEIIAKHSGIKMFFFCGWGLQLQYQESLICERVLKSFINRKIPLTVLPIHDGFICESKHKDKLLRAMLQGYKRITKTPHIKIKEM